MIEIAILGPIEATVDRNRPPLGPRGQRAVLALLALRPDQTVALGWLVEGIWGDDPPSTADNVVQGYVSKLRRVLGSGAILTQAPGYRLNVDAVDAVAFTGLVERADGLPPAEAALVLEEALGLWRGDFLADLSDLGPIRQEAARWIEERLAAEEALARAELELGRSPQVVARLEALVAQHPYREHAQALLVDALRGAGRRAEALRVAHAARGALADAGLDPGLALVDAERKALVGDNDESARQERTTVPGPANALQGRPGPVLLASVPRPASSFVGRSTEVEAIAEALRWARVVTLVGPGGAGKTRLALRVARDRPASFVDLARITNPMLVTQAAAAALGVVEGTGDVVDALRHWAAVQRDHLVIVDNCEHLVDAAAELVRLLIEAGPMLHILATSRERLGVAGETVWPVLPLDETDAAALFLTRLRALDPRARPAAELVAKLCDGLDRLPLAIELAAARAAALGVEAVYQRLGDRLRFLAGTRHRDERQGSLQAVVEWSHELLDERERTLFRRLSVFAGHFALTAAEQVCAAEPLSNGEIADLTARLVDKSLVRRDGRHFRLLETIRQYAAERLAMAGEQEALRSEHVGWALSVAADPASEEAHLADDDLRVALEWCEHVGDGRGFALAMVASEVAEQLGRRWEAQSRAETAARLANDGCGRGTALIRAAEIAGGRWRGDAAVALFGDAAASFREAGDPVAAIGAEVAMVESTTRFASSVRNQPSVEQRKQALAAGLAAVDSLPQPLAARVWSARGFSLRANGEPWKSSARLAIALAREAGDPLALSAALDAVEVVALDEGRFTDALAIVFERLELLDRLPPGPRGEIETVDILAMATECLVQAGDFARASTYAERFGRYETQRGVASGGMERPATTRFLTGDWDGSLDAGAQLVANWNDSGRPAAGYLTEALACVSSIHVLRGNAAEAEVTWRLVDEAASISAATNRAVFAAVCRADLAIVDGRPDEALRLLDAEAITGWHGSLATAVRAEAALLSGDAHGPDILDQARELARQDAFARAIILRAEGHLSAAVAAFDALPCPYQSARTALALDGEPRARALRTYEALGLTEDDRPEPDRRMWDPPERAEKRQADERGRPECPG